MGRSRPLAPNQEIRIRKNPNADSRNRLDHGQLPHDERRPGCWGVHWLCSGRNLSLELSWPQYGHCPIGTSTSPCNAFVWFQTLESNLLYPSLHSPCLHEKLVGSLDHLIDQIDPPRLLVSVGCTQLPRALRVFQFDVKLLAPWCSGDSCNGPVSTHVHSASQCARTSDTITSGGGI